MFRFVISVISAAFLFMSMNTQGKSLQNIADTKSCAESYKGKCIHPEKRCNSTIIETSNLCPGLEVCCSGKSEDTADSTNIDTWFDPCGKSKYPDATTSTRKSQHVVGGVPTRPGELPWQINLLYLNFPYAGGVLINERWVLTAAHNIDPEESINSYKVVLGDYNTSDTTNPEKQIIRISHIRIHPEYDPDTKHHDIALLKLVSTVTMTVDVCPACTPDEATDYTGLECTVSGWGATYEGGPKSNILMYANVPIISNEVCSILYERKRTIHNENICAGYMEGGKDACQGDSGGPLVCKDPFSQQSGNISFVLVGIVSWGNGCGQPGYPGVYTGVQHYLEWINQSTYMDEEPFDKDRKPLKVFLP